MTLALRNARRRKARAVDNRSTYGRQEIEQSLYAELEAWVDSGGQTRTPGHKPRSDDIRWSTTPTKPFGIPDWSGSEGYPR